MFRQDAQQSVAAHALTLERLVKDAVTSIQRTTGRKRHVSGQFRSCSVPWTATELAAAFVSVQEWQPAVDENAVAHEFVSAKTRGLGLSTAEEQRLLKAVKEKLRDGWLEHWLEASRSSVANTPEDDGDPAVRLAQRRRSGQDASPRPPLQPLQLHNNTPALPGIPALSQGALQRLMMLQQASAGARHGAEPLQQQPATQQAQLQALPRSVVPAAQQQEVQRLQPPGQPAAGRRADVLHHQQLQEPQQHQHSQWVQPGEDSAAETRLQVQPPAHQLVPIRPAPQHHDQRHQNLNSQPPQHRQQQPAFASPVTRLAALRGVDLQSADVQHLRFALRSCLEDMAFASQAFSVGGGNAEVPRQSNLLVLQPVQQPASISLEITRVRGPALLPADPPATAEVYRLQHGAHSYFVGTELCWLFTGIHDQALDMAVKNHIKKSKVLKPGVLHEELQAVLRLLRGQQQPQRELPLLQSHKERYLLSFEQVVQVVSCVFEKRYKQEHPSLAVGSRLAWLNTNERVAEAAWTLPRVLPVTTAAAAASDMRSTSPHST